ncbi:MAG: His/Gly/Thr/Pro-type tRNA ligase C-terminal domain-containing protein, partial [Candidatus Eremiobacteraeota bacterium]|nr:His/Gly/Thr/Pro-type tRNA ligase C-terminal domain-containing protein [Candidatus Eremiobacteraeota bacterium]
MVYTEAGEDLIASCSSCGYAANLEKATSQLPVVTNLAATGEAPELVHTPGQRTIDEVGAFLGIAPQHQLKTMAYMLQAADGKARAVVAFLRGDHTLNEAKLGALAGAGDLRPMQADEIEATFGAPAGYLGPVGIDAAVHPKKPGTLVILDSALTGRANMIAGANKVEYHFRNVTAGRDFKPTAVVDIRNANEGEGCPVCNTALKVAKAVEVGHIFKLGYKYSESMGASVLDRNGKAVKPIMGSYGIGIERILTAAIEQSAAGKDGESYALPAAIAPFEVVVTITNVNETPLLEAGEKIAAALAAAGFDVLLDDRDERAGVKFKDADLAGLPYRVNIGKKLSEGKVELVDRLTNCTLDVLVDDVARELRAAFMRV